MANATARHILVDSEEQAQELIRQLENGAEFERLAAEHSQCPSGASGGDLGEFEQGQMVPEFDRVVFHESIGEIHGPIATQFGYHVIEILNRNDH